MRAITSYIAGSGLALAVLVQSIWSRPDSSSGCSLTTAAGHTIDLTSLNNPSGNKVVTPLGNILINPCHKVTLCDAMQTGSMCCVQMNDTAHPGASRWISCGTTPHVVPLGGGDAPRAFETSLFCNLNLTWHTALVCGRLDQSVDGSSKGIVLDGGPDCGYVFAPIQQRVQASISFICDPAERGYGRVAPSSGFLGQHCGDSPSVGGTFRCINNQCVASAPGYSNATCAQGCGQLSPVVPPSECDQALTRLCGEAKRSSKGNCLICIGYHQQALMQAHCAQHDFDAFCDN